MSIASSLVTIIDTHYGDIAGGVKPEYIVELLGRKHSLPFPPGSEYIVVWLPIPALIDPINPAYVNVTHQLKVRMSTTENSARLKEIADEVRLVIHSNAVGGVSNQRISHEQDMSDRRGPIYIYEFIAVLEQHMIESGAAYDGWSATSHLHDGDTIIPHGINIDESTLITSILDEDNMASDLDTALATQQSIKAYVDALPTGDAFKTITGITNDVVADSGTDTLTLASTDAKLTIVGTQATDTITFSVIEAQIDHDALTNFVANEHLLPAAIDHDVLNNYVANKHIDHTGVTLTAGTGLSGGGDISANRTIDCDITQYTDGLAKAACVSDAVYAAGWNGVTDVAASKNAVFDKIETLGGGADYDAYVMKDAANGEWVPCCLMGSDASGDGHVVASRVVANSGGAVTGCGSSGIKYVYYTVPLPPAKNGLKLKIDDYRFYILYAEPTKYITNSKMVGINTGGAVATLHNDPTNHTTAGLKTIATAVIDCSAREIVNIELQIFGGEGVHVKFVSAFCYYTT